MPAFAWTWEFNSWSDSGSGSTACGLSSGQPCILWQEPHYTAVSINAYLDPSLNRGYYDFHPSVTNAFSNVNAVRNWGPNYYACYSPGCGPMSYSTAYMPCGVYGSTSYGLAGSEYTTVNGIGWYAFIRSTSVNFNLNTSFNNNFNFSVGPGQCNYNADGRKVAMHETGHTQGLGHATGRYGTAVMQQGAINVYTLQQDDINGLYGIYPGNQPSS